MAMPWFEKVICFGELDVRESQRASLRNLLQMEMFELHYDDLDSAIARLEAMVDQKADQHADKRAERKAEAPAGSRAATLGQTHA